MTEKSRAVALTTIGAAIAYVVVGVGFAAIANAAASPQLRTLWRLAAWVASGVVFAAQIGHEHFRLGSGTGANAVHCAVAAGLGAFGLAAFATLRSFAVSPAAAHWKFAVALVAWPVVTAIPAFVAGLAVAAVLGRARPAH